MAYHRGQGGLQSPRRIFFIHKFSYACGRCISLLSGIKLAVAEAVCCRIIVFVQTSMYLYAIEVILTNIRTSHQRIVFGAVPCDQVRLIVTLTLGTDVWIVS